MAGWAGSEKAGILKQLTFSSPPKWSLRRPGSRDSSVVTDANCFTALHCFLSPSLPLEVFCPNSSWLRYLGSSLHSLVETINGPVKILTCPFTRCGHKSLFLSYEFPQSRVISEKSSLILSLYCHIRLICISIFDVTRFWLRVNVMKKLIFHENINTLMILWSLLLCGMLGHKANYFFFSCCWWWYGQ